MQTWENMRESLQRGWNHLAEGWEELSRRASGALTRFRPARRGDDLETRDEWLMARSPDWGLLAADVVEKSDRVVVRVEAPGMSREDFDIGVLDDALVVRGEKRLERSDESGDYRIMECAYGAFERTVPLPARVEADQASARYRRGVLTVTLPKAAEARSRRIPVDAESD